MDISAGSETTSIEFGLTPTQGDSVYKIEVNTTRNSWSNGDRLEVYLAFLDTGEELPSTAVNGIRFEFLCNGVPSCTTSVMTDWGYSFFDNIGLFNSSGDVIYDTRRNLDKRNLAVTSQEASFTISGSGSVFSLEIVESSPVDSRFDSPTPDDKNIIVLWSHDFTGTGTPNSSHASWSVFSNDFGTSSTGTTTGEESSAYGISGLMTTFAVACMALTI
jgi:hypothetical protein